jgi:multidrug efflux pump subunit AcrB
MNKNEILQDINKIINTSNQEETKSIMNFLNLKFPKNEEESLNLILTFKHLVNKELTMQDIEENIEEIEQKLKKIREINYSTI